MTGLELKRGQKIEIRKRACFDYCRTGDNPRIPEINVFPGRPVFANGLPAYFPMFLLIFECAQTP